jgi:hypothetical protein
VKSTPDFLTGGLAPKIGSAANAEVATQSAANESKNFFILFFFLFQMKL